MGKYLLKGTWLFDGIIDQLIPDAAVIVENGKIIYAGPEDCVSLTGVKTYTYENATILPGLIDAHVHLTFDGSEDPIQKIKSDNGSLLPTLRAIKNAEKHIKAGITTIRDCGSRDYIIVEIAQAVRDGRLPGLPHILASGPVICITGGHGYFIGLEADGPHEVCKAVRKAIKKGSHFIKLIATGGVLTPGSKAGVTQFNLNEIEVAVKEASKAGLRSAAHAHGSEGIKLALEAGISTIEHASYIDDRGISLFLQTDAIAVSTLLASQRQVEHLTKIPKYIADKISCHIETEKNSLKRLIDAGIPIAGGTDAGTPFNFHGELVEQLIILSDCGLGNIGALKAGTYYSALALGLQDSIGILQQGKIADILVVKGNPVDNLTALKSVLSVWKSGEIIINKL